MEKPQITCKNSMWEEMFEDLEKITDRVIVIEKDGIVFTQGVIDKYTAPGSKKSQIMVKNTQVVERYLKEVKKEDYIYDAAIENEIFDLNSGITIKFYFSDPIIKYINEFYKEN